MVEPSTAPMPQRLKTALMLGCGLGVIGALTLIIGAHSADQGIG
ncbi:hypothetical protein [Gordonia rubripertincta]|nr:hypothetical protein [Gordonia rubripertincta]